MSSNKHPWEHKQPVRRSKTTKEEFEKLVDLTKEREDKFKSELFKGDPEKPKNNYRIIDGVPHKITKEGWKPLTKL